jgi:hypothetical protein
MQFVAENGSDLQVVRIFCLSLSYLYFFVLLQLRFKMFQLLVLNNLNYIQIFSSWKFMDMLVVPRCTACKHIFKPFLSLRQSLN